MYQTILARPLFDQTHQIYPEAPRRFLGDVATPHLDGGASEILREIVGRNLASA